MRDSFSRKELGSVKKSVSMKDVKKSVSMKDVKVFLLKRTLKVLGLMGIAVLSGLLGPLGGIVKLFIGRDKVDQYISNWK